MSLQTKPSITEFLPLSSFVFLLDFLFQSRNLYVEQSRSPACYEAATTATGKQAGVGRTEHLLNLLDPAMLDAQQSNSGHQKSPSIYRIQQTSKFAAWTNRDVAGSITTDKHVSSESLRGQDDDVARGPFP